MATASSLNSSFSSCNRDMDLLVEAFGASFSLEIISSAYSRASHNVDLAGVMLYELQETNAVTHEFKNDVATTSMLSLELSSGDIVRHRYNAKGNGKGLPQRNSVSVNSRGEYMKSTPFTNGSSEIPSYEEPSNQTASRINAGKDDSMHADFEDFLFRMLGDGFQLDKKTIHEVLGLCGYDLEKSMGALVDLSASTLEKSDDVVSGSIGIELHPKVGSVLPVSLLSDDRIVKKNRKESRKKSNDKQDLEKEILGALFTAHERQEELPRKTRLRTLKRRLYGRIVAEPMKGTEIEQTFVSVKPIEDYAEVEDEEDENSFSVLRQAVKENWTTMKEYYKAATVAYTKGDQERANKLIKEGQFYNRKAREADDLSTQKILEPRKEEMSLDISLCEPKEAIKLLKLQLSIFAGIPSFSFLKVTVGDGDKESRKGCLKRLVTKYLLKKSIEWTEEENGKVFVIPLDKIDPNSFNSSKELETH
ncbi:unnamed protein product [Amaranthus hypochondriacus]